MNRIRIACQTYSWEMLGDKWTGSVDDILEAIAAAGYEGVEITSSMLGPYRDEPKAFAAALASRGLHLAALGHGSPFGFCDPAHAEAEIAAASAAIEFVAEFPDPYLELAGGTVLHGRGRDAAFRQMLAVYAELGRIAYARHVRLCCHPHSHDGTLVETREEYARVLERTDPGALAFCPDTGHIVRSGNDLLQIFREHLSRIELVHFKDVTKDGAWAIMGKGVCDFGGVVTMLREAGYCGWIVTEEEADEARTDPAAAVKRDREFLRNLAL
jgi:sugar phosphate isomerase/epimerase